MGAWVSQDVATIEEMFAFLKSASGLPSGQVMVKVEQLDLPTGEWKWLAYFNIY